jgi:hypothetical protein
VLSDTISTTNGTVRIWSRPTLTITASSATINYGDPVPTVTASYDGFVDGDSAASLVAPPSCITTYIEGSSPGNYPTSCSGAVDPRYNILYSSGTVAVPYGPMTITASSATVNYGDPVPTITPTYVGEPDALLQTLPSCTTSYTQGSPPGIYETSCSGAVAKVGLTVCTGPIDNMTCTTASPLFDISSVTGTLTVERAPLTVTASSPAVTYGDPVPAIAAIYSGFVNTETAASLTTPATCTTAYTTGAGVGGYGTSCSNAASSNYAISYLPGSLTVGPKALTVTAANLTKAYGQTLTFSGEEFTTSGLINADTVTSVTLASAGAAAGAGVAGSPYPIVAGDAVGTGLANYVVGYSNGSLSVNPVLLMVTASSETMIVHGAVPAISPIYTGFVANDNETTLMTRPTCTTTATSESPVGVYPSTCRGAASPNYVIGHADGSVRVTYATVGFLGASDSTVSGGTIPIIFQLVDAHGTNLSSRLIPVTLASPAISPAPGSAPQPSGDFIDAGKQYVYILRTRDYPPGAYTLAFTVAGDPVTHTIAFVLR